MEHVALAFRTRDVLEVVLHFEGLHLNFLSDPAKALSQQLQKLGERLKKLGLALAEKPLLLAKLREVSGDVSSSDGWMHGETLRIHLAQKTVEVPVVWEPPVAVSCKLSSPSPVLGVPVSAEAELLRCTRAECTWIWERDEGGSGRTRRWQEVGRGSVYVPGTEDEGGYLRVSCAPPSPVAAALSQVSKEPVKAAPADAWRWQELSAPQEGDIRMATYNVLADAFATS
ncbi:unnamed protein product, partial [Effrenium voratum]